MNFNKAQGKIAEALQVSVYNLFIDQLKVFKLTQHSYKERKLYTNMVNEQYSFQKLKLFKILFFIQRSTRYIKDSLKIILIAKTVISLIFINTFMLV